MADENCEILPWAGVASAIANSSNENLEIDDVLSKAAKMTNK